MGAVGGGGRLAIEVFFEYNNLKMSLFLNFHFNFLLSRVVMV